MVVEWLGLGAFSAAARIQSLAWELKSHFKLLPATATNNFFFQFYILKRILMGIPVVVQWLTNPTRNHEDVGLIPGLGQWVKDPALP